MAHSPFAVVIAAYNEEEGITPTICELKEELNNPHLLVVDGKSSDRTFELAKDLGAEVLVQSGEGKGNAICEGLDFLQDDTVYVVFIDADYTYPAKFLKEMINILQLNPDIGMVLGDRFNKRYRLESDRDQFYVGNRILAFVQSLFSGIKLNDPFTGLRIVRFKLLKNWNPLSSGFDIEAELNHYIGQLGYGIAEVPISYRKRLGKKKLGFRHGLAILKRIIISSMYTIEHKTTHTN